MWQRYWNLDRDPFDLRLSPFVATPTHSAAVDQLVRVIEAGERSARLVGPPGIGKSTVLARAIEATRGQGRRFARTVGPVDGAELYSTLAIALGARLTADPTRAASWRALGDAVRLCRWQRLHVVLAIDADDRIEGGSRIDLDRLEHLDPDPSSRLTVIRVGRDLEGQEPGSPWNAPIGLDRLTRSETVAYLVAKLGAAGLDPAVFSDGSLTRLHAQSGGVPRAIDRLARLALIASALDESAGIIPEVIDRVAEDGPARSIDSRGGLVPGRRLR